MAALALPANDLFSIVTIADRGDRFSRWKSLLGLPEQHVDFAAATSAQRNLWAVRLDEAVQRASKPVLLVANGEGCFATAWWGRLSPASYVSKVAGALLFAPTGDGEAVDKYASPRAALPFPSAVIGGGASRASVNRRVQALAESWGSEVGDQTGIAGAQALLLRLTARVVERDMQVAGTFGIRLQP